MRNEEAKLETIKQQNTDDVEQEKSQQTEQEIPTHNAEEHSKPSSQEMVEPIQDVTFDSLSTEFPFLIVHSDPYVSELGFAFCNICQLKLKWQKPGSLKDHIGTTKHAKAQAKIDQRMEEFAWLELIRGIPQCRPCSADVPWKNLTRKVQINWNILIYI